MNASYPIVDKNDNLLYNLICSKKQLHNSEYLHRSVHLFVETFGGGFVLQKKAYGSENEGLWSSAVSGHVHTGETYFAAILRETEEELGLKIDEGEFNELFKCRACKETSNEIATVFSYLMDPDKEIIRPDAKEIDQILITSRTWVDDNVSKFPERYSPAFQLLFTIFNGGRETDVRKLLF
jgi:isopentenyldiphosphate isomerase